MYDAIEGFIADIYQADASLVNTPQQAVSQLHREMDEDPLLHRLTEAAKTPEAASYVESYTRDIVVTVVAGGLTSLSAEQDEIIELLGRFLKAAERACEYCS